MERISNQISYLKGLMEGLKFDEKSNEGKVFKAMMEVFDEINSAIDDLYDYQDEVAEQVDMIDEDLAAVEDVVLDAEECDECCGDDDEEFYEVECPNCKETVCIGEELLCSGDDIVCPNCETPIEIDFDCDCACDCKDGDDKE